MQVTIIGKHTEIGADTRSYMEEKANKLPHYYDRVMAAEVIVDGEHAQKRVEMVVTVAGHDKFVAEEKGNDFFACFDVCMDRVEKQLTRYKDKVRDHQHHSRAGREE
jgi:putative sigma-54 modulation protein